MKALPDKDELELIHGLINRDQHAIKLFIRKYQQPAFRTCMGFIHNREDAEEVTQDVLLYVINKIESFKMECKLSTWIYRICYSRSINKMKQKNWSKWISCFDDIFGFKESVTNEEDDNVVSEHSRQLHEAIDNLPKQQRLAFVLCKYEELSYKEIADIMETSISSVESLIYRAKQSLLQKLKNGNGHG